MHIIDNELFILVLVPILIGVLEAIKKTEIINVKYIPVLSLVLGVLLGIVFSGFELRDGILSGLFIGLSAVGLFSGTRSVYNGITGKSKHE